MASKTKTRRRARLRRKKHIRKHIEGTPERPRLCVFRSSKHIYAQVIDDRAGHTLVQASTLEDEFDGGHGGNVDAAEAIGKLVAERALEADITKVVFDRNGYLYHGGIAALADAARDTGLDF